MLPMGQLGRVDGLDPYYGGSVTGSMSNLPPGPLRRAGSRVSPAARGCL